MGRQGPRRLPLVGGGEHDWAYLLGQLGWLEHDIGIGRAVRLAGVGIFVYSIWLGLASAGKRVEERRLTP